MRTKGLSDVISFETDRTFTTLHDVICSGNITVRLDGQRLNIYRVGQKYVTIFKTAVSATVGVGNLSLSALLARLEAFELL